jgi:hypothetical protein
VERCGLDASASGYELLAGSCDTGMMLQVPYKVGNFVTSWVITIFSRRTLLHEVKSTGCFIL